MGLTVTPTLLALTVILQDDPRTWPLKARGRIESAEGVHLAYDIVAPNAAGALKVSYDAARPLRQKVEFWIGSRRYELLQSPQGGVYIDHEAKIYEDYQPLSFLLVPPPDTPMEACLPPPLFSDIPVFRQSNKWVVAKASDPAELTTEYVTPNNEVIKFRVTVDSKGVMTKIDQSQDTDKGAAHITWTSTAADFTLTDQASIQNDVPEGYVPEVFPRALGQFAAGAAWPDLPVQGDSQIKFKVPGRRSVIVVTAPDCDVCPKIHALWPELKALVEKNGGTLAELSLSATPPTGLDHPVAYDPDGKFMRELRLPMTPYIIVLDGQGDMVRGFAGYHDDQKKVLLDTVAKALKG